MSVLEGKRREVRRVIWQGSEHWCEFRDGRIVFADGRSCAEKDVVHLPPCQPTKIVCVHVNYISRYYEFNNTRVPPKTPTYFQKPLTALNSHGGELIRPAGYKYVNYEGEMAVIIGKGGRHIPVEKALELVWGYTLGLDMTRRDLQRFMGDQKKPWEIGKSFDRSAPIGAVHKVLTRTTYIGRHRFNTKFWKTRQRKPAAEVVEMAVPAIVGTAEFDAVQMLLKTRSPALTAPRMASLSSRVLFGGALNERRTVSGRPALEPGV